MSLCGGSMLWLKFLCYNAPRQLNCVVRIARGMAEQLERFRELERAAAELHRSLKRDAKALRSRLARGREAAVDRITPTDWQACAAVFKVSDDMEATVLFAKMRLRSAYFGAAAREELDEALFRARVLSLAADAGTQAALADHDGGQHFAAAKWVGEWRSFEWLVRLNFKGVAPPTRALAEEYAAQFPVASIGAKAGSHLLRLRDGGEGQKAWAHSFRRRWATLYRSLPTRPAISDAQIREKVCWGGSRVFAIICSWDSCLLFGIPF
jgi:hypothetical protein